MRNSLIWTTTASCLLIAGFADSSAAAQAGDKSPEPAARTWKDETGQSQVEAVLLGVQDGKTWLRRSDGKEFLVPLARLSGDDRQYIAEQLDARTVSFAPAERPEPAEMAASRKGPLAPSDEAPARISTCCTSRGSRATRRSTGRSPIPISCRT